MRHLLVAGLAGMLLSIPPAWAQNCSDASSQADLGACAASDFKKADHELNADFKEIEKRLADDAATKKLLTATQRAWIAFRDAECTFQSSAAADGSIHPMLVATCKAALTNDRVKQLKAYLACEEGDMSCPVPAGQ